MKTHPESVWLDGTRMTLAKSINTDFFSVVVSGRKVIDSDLEFVPASAYVEMQARLEKAEFSANGFESLYDAAHMENEQLKSRIATALDTILRFCGIDGDHHKSWVIDQIVRALTGDGYDKWVDDYKGETGPDGEREYDWDEGVAP